MAVNLNAPDPARLHPVAGVRLGTAMACVRKAGRRDLAVIELAPGANVAAVFTQNRFCAAPVQVCRSHLAAGAGIRALLVNTGNANAGTGADGLARARSTCVALAQKLGVSRGTVTNRITRLEDAGIIVGYTVRLRPDAQPDEIRAWMSIAVEGNETRAVIASLLGEPAVAELHDTNGRWDLLAELRAGSMGELSQVLERIRLLKGIRGTETSIQLATYR